MKYNSSIQRKADELAKKHGFFCACYIGRTEDRLVFVPRAEDNEPCKDGIAFYITFKDNKLRFERSLNFCKYDDKLTYRYFPKKGKAIFDIYKEMDHQNRFASEDDEQQVREIVMMSWGGGYDTSVPLKDICEALEIAERYNMTIDFTPDPSTTDRYDGWRYFVKIVPGKLPERLDTLD